MAKPGGKKNKTAFRTPGGRKVGQNTLAAAFRGRKAGGMRGAINRAKTAVKRPSRAKPKVAGR